MDSMSSCYQHKIIHWAKYCFLGLEGSRVSRLLQHQSLPVWGAKCPLKQTLSTSKCHTGTRVKCQSHCGGGFDQRSASSWRLSHSLWFLPPQIDDERSAEDVFAQICQVLETFWFVLIPTGPQIKFFFLSWSLYFSLALTPHNPHTPVSDISLIELQRCACPQNVPIAHSAKKKKKKEKFFSAPTKRLFATFCFYPVAVSLSHSLSLTSTNAENSWTEAEFCTRESYTPSCDWQHVSSGHWKKKKKLRGRRKRICQRELLMLSCTALCFVLYQACKNYNQASTAFCALKSRVEHHLSKTKWIQIRNVTQKKMH